MSHLIIDENNVVVNWIMFDGKSKLDLPKGHRIVEAPEGANIGWKWNGTKAIDPNATELDPTKKATPNVITD